MRERKYTNPVNAELGEQFTALIHRREQAWMSTRTDDFTGVRIKGDHNGGRVEGVRVINGTTDNGAMSTVHTIENTNAHHRPRLVVRYVS